MKGNHFLKLVVVSAGLGLMLAASPAPAVVVNLNPSKDATLPESATGVRAIGAGGSLFAGRTAEGVGLALRRAVLQFDLSSIPSGSTINSASLSLQCTNSVSAGVTFNLHKVTASWVEGPTIGIGSGGGVPDTAVTGDVTWVHRNFNSLSWTTLGGDFAVTSSASQSVGSAGNSYSWTSAQMAADVQDWLDNPGNNNGWILIGGEGTASTAKKFDDRTGTIKPVLSVDYSNAANVGDWILY